MNVPEIGKVQIRELNGDVEVTKLRALFVFLKRLACGSLEFLFRLVQNKVIFPELKAGFVVKNKILIENNLKMSHP